MIWKMTRSQYFSKSRERRESLKSDSAHGPSVQSIRLKDSGDICREHWQRIVDRMCSQVLNDVFDGQSQFMAEPSLYCTWRNGL